LQTAISTDPSGGGRSRIELGKEMDPKEGLMKITIDRTKCEGYAKCVQAVPKVFKLDDRFIAEVIDPQGDGAEKIILAAKICPTKAIILEEEETGKRVFPLE
jgi:ferredoxin